MINVGILPFGEAEAARCGELLADLTRKVQLGARTETEKSGVFTNKKVQVVAGTTDKLFCEGKTPEFYVESRDPTELSGLTKRRALIGIEDTQIGATALTYGLTVITSNTRHFERIPGLTVQNWVR